VNTIRNVEAAAVADGKGQPFSVRFSKDADLYIEEEARRTGRSKSAVVEDLALEAAKARRFPGIVFQEDWPDRRAVVEDTGFDVWQLCETIDNYGSVAEVVADFPLVTELHCQLARSYRKAYPEEIDQKIAANNRPREELEALYPFIEWVSYEELKAR
jgi:uncharacterized protein (DUF433 family)